MKKTVKHYLIDLVEFSERILRDTENVSEEEFSQDQILQDAILRRLEVLGETAKRVPDEFRSKHPEVPWREIARTRDKVIHNYEGVNISMVWEIAASDIKPLLESLQSILSNKDESYFEFEAA